MESNSVSPIDSNFVLLSILINFHSPGGSFCTMHKLDVWFYFLFQFYFLCVDVW